MKKDKLLIILLIIGVLCIIGKTIYNNIAEKNYQLEYLQKHSNQNYETIDSLIKINILLIDYYCVSENLLDSIFVEYPWPDAIDNYGYYEAIDNIYSYNKLIYNYLESFKKRGINEKTYNG